MRRLAAIAVLALVLGACTSDESSPTSTSPVSTSTAPTTTAAPPPTTTTTTAPEPIGVAAPYVRSGTTDEIIYFVMTDRFENGDPTNDRGSGAFDALGDGPLAHGFLPEHRGYFHGGDFAGLTSRLDYIAGLGATAIWVTPPFLNRAVQGSGTIENSTAGYHGYWQVDYSRIDPHLGTNREFKAFVDAAHDAGLKVVMDVVTNHTGDAITYEEGIFSYLGTGSTPYRDASGTEFDLDEVVGSDDFPELDVLVSFPYTPVALTDWPKSPDWLNDLTLYHNRGNSTFTGQSSTFGDFFGLDDLFTEHPRVVEGFVDLHTWFIRAYDIDGYRVDTVKHVNDEFWQVWVPAVLDQAAASGKEDFILFGEIFGESSAFRSEYTSEMGFPAVLDFGFNNAVKAFTAQTQSPKVLADHFDDDDWFTDTDSNAGMLTTFIGNHDEGRIGDAIENGAPGANDEQRLARSRLAHELLFLSRGIPIVYYGDEQGFTGDGGDQGARQDMFPSKVDSYNDDDLIGTTLTTADDNFDPTHPLYRTIATLSALRAEHPTLASGAHITRYFDTAPGVYAGSRIDPEDRVEYVIAFNNSPREKRVTVPTDSPGISFSPLYGSELGTDGDITDRLDAVTTDQSGGLEIVVPPFGAVVLRAEAPIPPSAAAPSINFSRPTEGAEVPLPRFRVEAALDSPGFVEVTFSVSIDGGPFEVLGTDLAPPYRVFWNTLPYADGSSVEIMATVDDFNGHRSTGSVTFTLIERPNR